MTTAGLSARATRNQLTQSPGPGNIADPLSSREAIMEVAIDFGGSISVDFDRLERVNSRFSSEYIPQYNFTTQTRRISRVCVQESHKCPPYKVPTAVSTRTYKTIGNMQSSRTSKGSYFFHTRHGDIKCPWQRSYTLFF